jgi:hypothetical protein
MGWQTFFVCIWYTTMVNESLHGVRATDQQVSDPMKRIHVIMIVTYDNVYINIRKLGLLLLSKQVWQSFTRRFF